jgi:hypothetical protein
MEILKYLVSEVNMDVRIWGRLGVTGSLCWLWLAVIRVILTFGLLLGNSIAGSFCSGEEIIVYYSLLLKLSAKPILR